MHLEWWISNDDVTICFLSDILCCAEKTFDIACSRERERERERAALLKKRDIVQNNFRLFPSENMDGKFPALCRSVYFGVPMWTLRVFRERFGSTPPPSDQRKTQVHFDTSCSCRRINRKKMSFKMWHPFWMTKIPSQQGARLKTEHAGLFLTGWGQC